MTEYKVSIITKKSIPVIKPETHNPIRLTGSILEQGADYKNFSSEKLQKRAYEAI
ncbi:hypothetical protein OM427_30590 [Halomonas sp. 18H]|nr:hypothetical protein [Halomonas sp. 18H]MCW4153852.1 hypothetical protein [Halomonas sp. 18H]